MKREDEAPESAIQREWVDAKSGSILGVPSGSRGDNVPGEGEALLSHRSWQKKLHGGWGVLTN